MQPDKVSRRFRRERGGLTRADAAIGRRCPDAGPGSILTLALALIAALPLILPAPAARAGGLTDYVNPLAGTRPGPRTFGGGHNFPGATVPFGMVQWSPDTTPADVNGAGGYDYRDNHIKGFSLTHMSGAGCEIYGDFPFLPTTEPLVSSPAGPGSSLDGALQPGFSHADERARPGFYAVSLNPIHGGRIDVELTATTRSGVARFTFPRGPHSSVLIDAGGSAQPDDFSSVRLNPDGREIDGSASSGLFCGQRPRYKVYFAAIFNRPFGDYGTWSGSVLAPGSTEAAASQAPPANPAATAASGAYATFDSRRNRSVVARVGISFVSVEDARANLAAEDPGLGFGPVAKRAEGAWERSLGRVRVSGGPRRLMDTFYTALYHAFLAPRTFSDVGGAYIGMDGLVHRARGRIQYADFSGWDIYRTEIQLLSMLVPDRAGDMVRSLLADAAQSGCLPRWSYANGQSMTMVGDSADPIIASAAAFGARRFDSRKALAAMVYGATSPCRSGNGEYVERQGLAYYLARGFIPRDVDTNIRNANSIYGDPEAVWGSAATTLEYTIDDFAIAQFAARVLRDRSTYRTFIERSATWRRLFDPASGLIEPRDSAGGFPAPYNPLEGGGFVEGNAYQYTWLVPQDPAGLFRKMGGNEAAAHRLDSFLRVLNGGSGGTHTNHALLGNEPTLHVPWLYDWARQPFKTQAAVRRALLGLYDASPDGYPGNDDLGTLSAWYVFGALGLYPEVPGVGLLAIGSPLFARATIAMPHHRRAVILTTAYKFEKRRPAGGHRKRTAPRKIALPPAAAPYIRSMRLDGRLYDRPWVTYCTLARGGRLAFELGPNGNPAWGSAAAAEPPSFGPQRPMPKDPCLP
ncbi:MAG: GH92 family glycosyl hydrolase [Solirubrobacterales bacterium]